MGIKEGKKNKNLEKIVISSLSNYFNIPAKNIRAKSRLVEDLGMDSFGLVELTFELKERLGIEIKKEILDKIHTVNDIIDYLGTCLKNKQTK